jgi:hypothetical protein
MRVRPLVLKSTEVFPYVIGVIHFYWFNLNELYKALQKVDSTNSWTTTPHISELGSISATYYPHIEKLTLYASGPTVHDHGYVLWNGTLKKDQIRDWAYEDMLYDLLRIYKAVKSTVVCSNVIGKPNGHDVAEATQIVQMVRRWSYI